MDKRLNLKIARIRKGISQKDLASKIGLTGQSISEYENGRLNPSYDIMKKISEELDTSVDELFFNE